METYTVIPDSLLELDLTLTETVCLAVIHGFCQDGKSDFHLSYDYLAKRCKCSRRHAIRMVERLQNLAMIKRVVKGENGASHVSLRTTLGSLGTSDTMSPGGVTSCHRSGDTMSPVPAPDTLYNTLTGNNKRGGVCKATFVAPSRAEVRDYFKERGFASDPDEFWLHFENCDWRLSSGRGRTMKDWRLAAISWEKRESRFRR